MKTDNFELDDCCLPRQAIQLIADKWTILILYALVHETKRYSEIYRELDCITHKMLAQTLRQLERNGFLHRKIYATVPPKTEYSLTELGKTLLPILSAIVQWGAENIENVEKAQTKYDNVLINKGQASLDI